MVASFSMPPPLERFSRKRKGFKLPYLPGGPLKRLVRLLIIVRSYSKEVWKCVGRYPLRDVLFGARHGFAADRVFLYGKDSIVSGNYLTDFQRQFSRFINPKPVRELLEDKLLFACLVGRMTRVPTNHLYSDNNRLVVLSDEWHTIAHCRDPGKVQRLVMKRARGGGGIKISFMEMCQGVIKLSNQSMPLNEFYEFFAQQDEHIVCEFIEQSSFFRQLYPRTTNTLRVICMRDKTGEPFIARAILRLGTERSKDVDNFGQGGLAVNVDLNTGALGQAIDHDSSAPREPRAYARHPDSDAPIAGEFLHGWIAARDEALSLMRQLPFINYVGWDIVLTDSGPVFLEGNNYTGVRLAQIETGLLCDSRVREFYERFGII